MIGRRSKYAEKKKRRTSVHLFSGSFFYSFFLRFCLSSLSSLYSFPIKIVIAAPAIPAMERRTMVIIITTLL